MSEHVESVKHGLFVEVCREEISSFQITALSGETDMTGPPPVSATKKNRFRNGHASFRLRMLQEQHGPGFEPVR